MLCTKRSIADSCSLQNCNAAAALNQFHQKLETFLPQIAKLTGTLAVTNKLSPLCSAAARRKAQAHIAHEHGSAAERTREHGAGVAVCRVEATDVSS